MAPEGGMGVPLAPGTDNRGFEPQLWSRMEGHGGEGLARIDGEFTPAAGICFLVSPNTIRKACWLSELLAEAG